MNAEFEATLIECLSALDAGESIEQLLARFPAESAELRPILMTAAALPAFRMEPSEAQKIASRKTFLSRAAELRKSTTRRRFVFGAMPRLASALVASLVLVVVLGGGAVAASGSALPGDPLYSLKRTVENVRLALTLDSANRSALQDQFDQARRLEANALLDAGRETEVEFSGPIESIQPNSWVVAGLVVRINAATQIVGQPQNDRLARVRGVTGLNGLTASFITIEGGDDQTPTPLPTSTPPVLPTSTPTPPATQEPEPTESRPTRQPTSAPTRVPTRVSTPQPAEIEFTGAVDSIGGDTWSINGAIVFITNETQISDGIGVGQRVKVKALRFADGRLVARKIELTGDGGGQANGNDNQNSNQNQNQNENQNGNSNENQNGNDNENHNGNSNDNGGGGNDNGGSGGGNDSGGGGSNDNGGGGGNDNGGGKH